MKTPVADAAHFHFVQFQQSIGSYLDIPFFIRLLKQHDEGFVIFGVQENIFLSPATINDMITSAWEFSG